MITTIRRFYRRMFCSRAKAAFLELFERHAKLNRAIVFEEVSPLAGILTTYLWQEFPENGRLIIQQADLKKKTRRTIVERDLPKTEVADVLRFIEETGGAGLGNFSGKVIDGVFYNVWWGDLSRLFHLNIKNPQFGSERHQQFISMLKMRAGESNAGEF